MADINRVQFVAQDFDTYVEDLQTFILNEYPDEYNDYTASQLATALIELIAYAGQNIAWYQNRKASDLYFPTAVSPKAISKVARWLGYKPRGATASRATLNVTLKKAPFDFPVRIERYFQFKGPNQLVFEYRGLSPVVYSPGETVKTFEVFEGVTQFKTFVSNGNLNQIFKLLGVPPGKYIEDGSVTVRIKGEDWVESPIIPFQAGAFFETNLLSDPPTLKFGDGVQGLIPPANEPIEVSFVVCNGFNGRILKETIRQPVVSLVSQFQTIDLTVIQLEASIGGEEPESLASIVTNAPVFQRTQDRAVTKGDYDYLSNAFPNVARADAQVLRGVSADVAIQTAYAFIRDDLDNLYRLSAQVSGYADVDALADSVSGNIAAASGYLPNIEASLAGLSGALGGVSGYAKLIGDENVGASGQVAGANTNTVSASVEIEDLTEDLRTQMQLLTAYAGVSGPAAEAAVQSIIIAVTGTIIPAIDSQLIAITGGVVSPSGFQTIGTYLGFIDNELATTLGGTVPTLVSGVRGELSAAQVGVQSIRSAAADIAELISVSGYAESVSGYLTDVEDYLNETYADGCNGNTVQVAVLAEDSARRFVPPSEELLADLKAHLEERKDAVHSLSVVPGTVYVINAHVRVECVISPNAVRDDVLTAVQNALDKSDEEPFGILVKRTFNKSLYNSEIYNVVRAAVEERQLPEFNVIISGPTQYLDARNNLICPQGFVIQAGTIEVVAI